MIKGPCRTWHTITISIGRLPHSACRADRILHWRTLSDNVITIGTNSTGYTRRQWVTIMIVGTRCALLAESIVQRCARHCLNFALRTLV